MITLPRPILAAALAALAALAIVASGCSGTDDAARLTITKIGWYEENIDPSIWTSPPPNGQTAFYDFFVHYTGDITYADLRSVRMVVPDGHAWNLLPDATYLDTTKKVIGGFRHWYASPSNVLAIGAFRAEITLADGTVVTATREIPAPGSTTAGGFTSMHTEDAVSPPTASAPMVRRVTMGAGGVVDTASQTVTFSFSTVDPLAYNGSIWLYDAAGTYLGGLYPLRDPATGAVSAALGGVLRTDGTPNAVTLRPEDLRLEAGATFSQIARVVVAITDGAQYVAQLPGGYDCRSIGPMTALTVQ